MPADAWIRLSQPLTNLGGQPKKTRSSGHCSSFAGCDCTLLRSPSECLASEENYHLGSRTSS